MLSDCNIICKEKFEVLQGKNTTDVMVNFSTKAINALDEKCKAVGALLDLQTAIIWLDHEILGDRLCNMGIWGVSPYWIKSFPQGTV